MSILHIVAGVVWLYVVCRLILPLRWPAGRKCLAGLVLLAVSQHHFVSRTFFGTMASPELPFAVLLSLGWLFGAFVLLAVLLLARDGAAVVLWPFRKADLLAWFRPSQPQWGCGLCVAALSLSAVGVWQAVRVPDVHTVEIGLANLPPELDGLRLVQLTDLHASRLLRGSWVRGVVDKANALNPDLILLTGDLADGAPGRRAEDVAPLADLKARLGVFAIPGNHEYYSDYPAWMDAYRALGLRLLLNGHVVIRDRGRSLVLAGTTDRAASGLGQPAPDIDAALSGAPRNAVTILMAHQPRGAAANAGAGVDLQLSGHTHGGQMPGLRQISQYLNEDFVSGLYRVGGMRLYVSNGTGLWNGFPIRLGAPAEIAEIVLRAVPR